MASLWHISLIVLVLPFGGSDANTAAPQQSQLDVNHKKPLQTFRPYNIAHRGSNGEIPEETAAAYLVLRGLGNLVAGDGYMVDSILIVGNNITDQALSSLIKCLKSDNRVLRKEASWALSNIAAGSFEHKKLIFTSEATPLLIHHLASAQFDIRKEAAYTLSNLCVVPAGSAGPPNIIVEHLVSIINSGALPGFIYLVRSADIESARLGLQFLELVMRGYPNGQGPKLVEREDGIEAMEKFQFHENEVMRNMANGLVDKYFGEDYGLE